MDHGLKLAAVGGSELVLAALIPWPWSLVIAWPGSVTLAMGLATWARTPGILGKRDDGSFPLWSLAVFLPWHLLYRALGTGKVLARRPPTEVHAGWWVGGWPEPGEIDPWPAIVDVTAELPRIGDGPYHLVRTMDRGDATPEVIERAAQWAVERHDQGPVLVHCTQGRGRSVMVLCAALVKAGLHATWREAYAHLEAKRPFVRMQTIQKDALDAWEATCG
ncbi:MAG: hypothetical protein EP330_26545 [Deltaproteobacteria bacterium]|nr:MAG: hypothetical protein EP330_26545 [Deltaproteobacteria bacterium]